MTVSNAAPPSSAIISRTGPGPGPGPGLGPQTQQSQVTTTSAPNTTANIPNSAPQLSQQQQMQQQQQQQRMVRPPATSAMPMNPNIR